MSKLFMLRVPGGRATDAGKSKAAIDFAEAALSSGQLAQARMRLSDRLLEDPSDANALTKLAEILVDEARFEEASVFLRRAAAADPAPDRQVQLIRHLHLYGSPGTLLQEVDASTSDTRARADVRSMRAAALGAVGRLEQQLEMYEAMLRGAPKNSALWKSVGNLLKTMGRTDEAVSALRKSIALKPQAGDAYWSLANFKTFRFTDKDVAAMLRAVGARPGFDDAVALHFALGKAFEDRSDFHRSFQHYEKGNSLKVLRVDPAHTSATDMVDGATEVLTRDFFQARADWGAKEPGPIFVLGMHRSGSTLIEQILGSHSQVEGTTELAVLNQIKDRIAKNARSSGAGYWQAVQNLGREEFERIGHEYLHRTRAFRLTSRPFFIDKMPSNWTSVALIRVALPNAIIIDARRNPMACGFSNFKQLYAKGAAYSYSLETMGAYYRDYWRMMKHMDAVQPGAVHRVLNEELIASPEAQIRLLLEQVGLPFEESCLSSHENKRAVRTPSAEQVRRPINSDGVDLWRNYEQWLSPLTSSLGPALSEWDS